MNNDSPYNNIQQFKIGRIKYNLPSMINKGGSAHFLSFNYGEYGAEWHFCYRWRSEFSSDTETVLDCYTKTFNQGVKALWDKIKADNARSETKKANP